GRVARGLRRDLRQGREPHQGRFGEDQLSVMPAARSIPWDIYEEHLDEAAFLWGQWESALDAATFALHDVMVGPEERLRAHLDGLVLGGARVAEKLLVPALGDDDAGKIAAA